MSIVRVGLGENKEFADGYEAIFGKKPADKKTEKKPEGSSPEKPEEKKPEEKK
jgi:hypothetical protein